MTGAPVELVARAISRHQHAFIRALVTTIEAEIADLEHDEILRGLLDASITENVVTCLHLLSHGIDPRTADAPVSALAYARRLAQRDVSLSALLRAYRLGQAQSLELVLTETLALDLPDPARTLADGVALVGAYVDRICDQVGQAYEEERERWISNRSALRQYWIGQLLDNPAVDARQAEAALDYRLAGHHLAVEAWLDPGTRPGHPPEVFQRLLSLLHAVDGVRGTALSVPVDEDGTRIWLPLRPGTGPHAVPDAVSEAMARDPLPVRIALGTVRGGLDGFRRSTRGAARAKALAVAAGPAAPRVVSFAEVAPVALLVDDARELADFVHDTLGDLGTDDPRQAVLRGTLRAFLAANRSYTATAERLTVHRNTVHYRVSRALESLGTSLEDTPLQVRLALDVCHWHASRVLHPAPDRAGR